MPLDSKALGALRDGLREGSVRFRFEGRLKGKVHLWVELSGDREGDNWSCRVAMGDGGRLSKTIPHARAEEEFTEILLGMNDWMNQKPRS